MSPSASLKPSSILPDPARSVWMLFDPARWHPNCSKLQTAIDCHSWSSSATFHSLFKRFFGMLQDPFNILVHIRAVLEDLWPCLKRSLRDPSGCFQYCSNTAGILGDRLGSLKGFLRMVDDNQIWWMDLIDVDHQRMNQEHPIDSGRFHLKFGNAV